MYDTPQLIADITSLVEANAPKIVAIAIIMAVLNFIILWFFRALSTLHEGLK